MAASDYRCARYSCSEPAAVVYQGPNHPAIYGACLAHTMRDGKSILEGVTIVHFDTAAVLQSNQDRDPRTGLAVMDGVGVPHPFDPEHCGAGRRLI